MKTYGTVSGVADHRNDCRNDPVALAELLVLLTDEVGQFRRWWHTWRIPSNGTITIELNIIPAKLSAEERDAILSFVAKLTNWTNRDQRSWLKLGFD